MIGYVQGLEFRCLIFATGRKVSNATVIVTKLDVRDRDGVDHWVQATFDSFGVLHGAANVAGVAGGNGDTIIETIVPSPSPQFTEARRY